jgi:hypothetical protein
LNIYSLNLTLAFLGGNNTNMPEPTADLPAKGTVASLRSKFEKGKPAQSPVAYKETAKAAVVRASPGVRQNVASYNLALRGAQVKAQRRATMLQQQQGAPDKKNTDPYELLAFTEEYEDYPWHLAAQFVDDDDAFWVPDLAAALDTGDERLINETVLRLFFEEHDQSMVNAVDDLLETHQGREDELFEELQKEYIQLRELEEEKAPPPPSAVLTTEQKRRPSFIVSAVKKPDGEVVINPQDESIKEKMLASGATEEETKKIVEAEHLEAAVVVEQSADV